MLKTATLLCLVMSFVAIVLAVVCHLTKFGPPIAVWLACFLFAFGLGKGLVAVDKLVALRAVAAGGPDPRVDFSNRFIFWAYITTKFAVWGVAWAVGMFLLGRPEALSVAR